MFAMFASFGTLSYEGVFAAADTASSGMLTAIGLLLLLGACAKSAQIPVQAWLFDAMEGPTPVSALIHAATKIGRASCRERVETHVVDTRWRQQKNNPDSSNDST